MTVLVSVTKTDLGYTCTAAGPGRIAEWKLPRLLGLNREQAHTALARAGAKIIWSGKHGDPIEGIYALPIK